MGPTERDQLAARREGLYLRGVGVSNGMQLTLYGRKDCCLCDEMAQVVAVVAAERGLDVVKVDIDEDPALAAAYGAEIPVLFAGAQRIVSGRVSLRALRALVARSGC